MVDGWISCYVKSLVGDLTSKPHRDIFTVFLVPEVSVEAVLFKVETPLVNEK